MSHRTFGKQKLIGIVLLLLSFEISILVIFWGSFVDSADNVTAAKFITQGYVLYRDIFSHHFPFPYYWLAGVMALFGRSIFVARLSVLLFQVISFAWAMRLTHFYIPIGVGMLVWSIIGHAYGSNLVTYPVFSGISLTMVFLISLTVISRRVPLDLPRSITIGVFAGIAILSDPLSVYPVAVVMIFLILVHRTFKRVMIIGGLILLQLIGWYIYFNMVGAFTDFYKDAILFNTNIYSRYIHASPYPFKSMFLMFIRLLDVASPMYFNIDPMMDIGFLRDIDNWIFTGFLYRFSTLVAVGYFLSHRKFLEGSFVYVFAVTLLAKNQWGFRSIPFVLIAIMLAAFIITNSLQSFNVKKQQIMFPSCSLCIKLGHSIWGVTKLGIALLLLWFVLRSGSITVANWSNLSYNSTFGFQEYVATIAKQISCDQPDVSLAYYTSNPLIYFLTGMKPVSKYVFMYPWVAEVAENDVVSYLENNPSVVHLDASGAIWGIKNSDFAAKILSYVNTSYYEIEPDWYVSPSLVELCDFDAFHPLNMPPEYDIRQIDRVYYNISDDVKLMGIHTVISGDQLTVDLLWKVYPTRENMVYGYTGYVHVLDNNGKRLAGSDVYIKNGKGLYNPKEQIFTRHIIPLSNGFSPKKYTLKIGVYHFDERQQIIPVGSVQLTPVENNIELP